MTTIPRDTAPSLEPPAGNAHAPPGSTPPLRNPLRFASLLAVAVLLALAAAAGTAAGNPNEGDVKVHDGAVADPPTRNEPHVSCDGFWVEGFNMEDAEGTIAILSWPPTGDKQVVLEDNWTADGGEPEHHFLNGPYTLEAGHYRLEVSNGEPEPGQMKFKMFWADCGSGEEELACPTGLTATPQADGSVLLSFTPANGSDGTNVYRLEGDTYELIATVDANATGYLDNTTVAGQGYTYTVTALFGDAESRDCPAEAETTAIPEFPTVVALGLATGGGLLALAFGRRRKA